MTIQPARIEILADRPERPESRYVLYWMQQSQRVAFNPALEFAVEAADRLGLPVLVCFGLTDGYPEANARHYAFMLEGLAEVRTELLRRGIGFVIRRGDPDAVALDLSGEAALVVCDRGYLAPQRLWRTRLAGAITVRLVQIEGDVVVPVDLASPKHEVGARTLRPKLHRLWHEFLLPLAERPVRHRADELDLASDFDLTDTPALVRSLAVDQTIAPVRRFQGGTGAALERLEIYLGGPFAHYAANRSKPEAGAASQMSPYLHFGQISPVDLALRVRAAASGDDEDRAAYIEELVVRRELAMNHVAREPAYARYEAMPAWARATLNQHRADRRPHLYTREQFEAAETHDRHWNAAMREMRVTGYMHNHMRMYWGKKVLEWSASPEAAFETLLAINNRYFLDGRDANSFTNVGWIFGLHDRPWPGRAIYGSVRMLGQATLKKFDADAYVVEVERLCALETPGAPDAG